MQVQNGDLVSMRDGRIVLVTDAADHRPDEYVTVEGEGFILSALSPETIFLGDLVSKPRRFRSRKEYPEGSRPRVASDMSEVLFGSRGGTADSYGVGFR
jgi:hypothetical protein